MADVVILGAGLTGLSTAYHLEQQGFHDYRIFEKNDRPGGLLQSVSEGGFTFDHTGHLLHISDDYFKKFLNSLAPLDQNFLYIERKSSIYSHNVISHYPYQMNLHGLPTDIISECIEGFIKRSKRIKQPSNFYEWVLKYFGTGFAKHFFVPYNSKLLSYNIKQVTPSWTGRFVPQTNLKAILEGALRNRYENNVGYNSFFYYPKKDGIEFIIKQLVKQLQQPIFTNYKAHRIDQKNKIIYFSNGHSESYRQLVSTMPLDTLIDSLDESSNTSFYQALPHLECNAVINLNLGFARSLDQDKHWIYFPEKKYRFYRIGFWHNICRQLVKQGCSALYAETSYLPSRTTPLQRQNLVDQTREQLLDFFSLQQSDIIMEKILHLKHAYVIYNYWRERHLHQLLTQLTHQAIHSIGRFGEWKYSSMQEAIMDGLQTAGTIIENLKATTIVPARRNNTPTTQQHPSMQTLNNQSS